MQIRRAMLITMQAPLMLQTWMDGLVAQKKILGSGALTTYCSGARVLNICATAATMTTYAASAARLGCRCANDDCCCTFCKLLSVAGRCFTISIVAAALHAFSPPSCMHSWPML